jgi:hypothetical protein
MDHRWAGARLVERAGTKRIAVGGARDDGDRGGRRPGFQRGTLRTRLKTGWPVADALTKPLDTRGSKRRRADQPGA